MELSVWNYRMKLSIESECFMHISFYFVWRGSFENNVTKLYTETVLVT